MTITYLKPAATGTGVGTDWDNANTMANFAAIYAAQQPGDEIWLSSVGTHVKTGTTTLTNANGLTEDSPVRVRGMRPYGTVDGYPEKAIITGARTVPWPRPYLGGATSGGTLFSLSTGAKYTSWESIVVMNHDIGWKTNVAGDHAGISLLDCEAINVRAGFSSGVTTTGVRIRRFIVNGFTLQGVYVAGDSSDIVVEDVDVYQLGFDDNSTSNTARAFMLDVSAHNARFRRCRAFGGFDYNAGYWNGDGFTSEEDCYDVIYEDCYASDWPDGGWDTKASGNILRRCVSERNSRNYRFAAQRVAGYAGAHIVEDCRSLYPIARGGSGSAAHIQMPVGLVTAQNRVIWRSSSQTMGDEEYRLADDRQSLIESHDPTVEVVLFGGRFSALDIYHTIIRKHPDAPLAEGRSQQLNLHSSLILEEA